LVIQGRNQDILAAAKISARSRKNTAEGGCGGNSAAPERKRQHASACSFRAERRKQNFLFLLEEKEIACQIKKCEENFFAEQRAK